MVRNAEVRSPSITARHSSGPTCSVGRGRPFAAGERGEHLDGTEPLGKLGVGAGQRVGVGGHGDGAVDVGLDSCDDLVDRRAVAAADADQRPVSGKSGLR